MAYDATSHRTARAPERAPRRGVLLGVLALALLVGYGTNQIPSWDFLDGSAMWVNELGAPYAALAWLGGMACPRSDLRAAVGGVLAVVVAFFGYYAEILVETGGDPLRLLGLTNPWLAMELALGTLLGVAGRRWWVCGDRRTAVLAGILPVLEALAFATGLTGIDIPALNLYPPTYPWSAWNLAFWAVEAATGVLVGVWLLRRAASRRTVPGEAGGLAAARLGRG